MREERKKRSKRETSSEAEEKKKQGGKFKTMEFYLSLGDEMLGPEAFDIRKAIQFYHKALLKGFDPKAIMDGYTASDKIERITKKFGQKYTKVQKGKGCRDVAFRLGFIQQLQKMDYHPKTGAKVLFELVKQPEASRNVDRYEESSSSL